MTLDKIKYKIAVNCGGDRWIPEPTGRHIIIYVASQPITGDWVTRNCVTSSWTSNSGVGQLVLNKTVTEIGGEIGSPFNQNRYVAFIDMTKSGIETVAQGAFYNATNLVTVKLPSAMTSLSPEAFYHNSSLNELSVSHNIKYYSEENCIIEATERILVYSCGTTIPSSVTTIGYKAFYGSSMESFTIPSNVLYVQEAAFGACNNLTTALCYNTIPPFLGENNFTVVSDTLYVPLESINAYRNSNWADHFGNILPIEMPQYVINVTVQPADSGDVELL